VDNFLIPANAKKSQLIFGYFNKVDMIIIGVGVGISLLLLMAMDITEIKWAIVAIAPGLVAAFLVCPIPHYHNVITVIRNIIVFYTTRQEFVWKGWCVRDGEEDSDK
jgi:hypothetical protein